MIIVKTSNGDVFINDAELIKLTHDRDNHFVYATMKGELRGTPFRNPIRPIDKVTSVTYINNTTDKEYKDDGSEVAFLRRQLAEEKNLVGFLNALAKDISMRLRDFSSYIIQEVNYGKDDISDDVRKRLRGVAEECKAYANNDDKWWERRKYMEEHQKQAEDEAARTAELNNKVEEQAARILELEKELEDTRTETTRLKYQMADGMTEPKRGFWQRLLHI